MGGMSHLQMFFLVAALVTQTVTMLALAAIWWELRRIANGKDFDREVFRAIADEPFEETIAEVKR
jgi:hypothetical protein